MPPLAHPDDRALPTGAVTFLMSDVEGSSVHWTAHPGAMATSMRELDTAVVEGVTRRDGTVIKPRGEGDSHFAVFDRPSQAVLAACEIQTVLRGNPVGGLALRVRVSVHTGEVGPVEDDYYGIPVNQTARLRSLAHGGQTLVSHVTALHVEPALGGHVRLKSLGHHTVRDFPRVEEIFQASLPGADEEFPPLQAGSTRGPAVMAVLLIDVCGASELTSMSSAADVLAMQRRWITAMRRSGDAHGAASLKVLGDGCLVAFEDPADGLAFARSLRVKVVESGLQIRAGLAAGRVELFDGEVMGQATFVAAELMRTALPGEIVMTAMVRDLLGDPADVSSLGRRTVEATGSTGEIFAG